MPLHVTDWVNNMNLWVFLSKKDVAQLKKNQNWSARQCNSPLVYGCSCSRNRNLTPLNPPRTQTKGSAVLWPVSLLTFPNPIPNFPTSHCYLLTYLCFIFVQPCLFPICIFHLTFWSLLPHDLTLETCQIFLRHKNHKNMLKQCHILSWTFDARNWLKSPFLKTFLETKILRK